MTVKCNEMYSGPDISTCQDLKNELLFFFLFSLFHYYFFFKSQRNLGAWKFEKWIVASMWVPIYVSKYYSSDFVHGTVTENMSGFEDRRTWVWIPSWHFSKDDFEWVISLLRALVLFSINWGYLDTHCKVIVSSKRA